MSQIHNAPAENNENLPEGSFGSDMDGYLDQIITRIMTAGYTKPIVSLNAPEVDIRLTVEEIRDISRAAADSFMRQRSLIRLSSDVLPVTVVGDLHGQLVDLRKIISRCGDPSTCTYIFLGDYVDRGTQGLELAILLFCYQMRYPDRVFLLRGNHEDLNTTSTYGFYDECMQKYGKHGEWVYLALINAFNHLPLCAIIGEKVLCMHGGLSPHIDKLDDIEQIPRPSIIPPYGLMCDIVWSDPDSQKPGWSLSCRGISFSFDESVVEDFCQKHGLDLIVRAHQITGDMVRGGHRMFAGGRLVTIFSAPNYQNMMNDGCVLRIKRNFSVNFFIFRPVTRRLPLQRRHLSRPLYVRCLS
ncbi:hypothetical protein V3C99_005223 [Haemonchus contortus]|uniref:Serine/threonine-protein phosphatase n=1 Tax=Haemonchus contortus TaxID=6289 RepID=A0A7I4XWK4_HAECO|nr:Metallophosphoesterase domain containing protein [Haemonchus contortus]